VSGPFAARSGVALDRALYPVIVELGSRGPLRTTSLAKALSLQSSTVSRHVSRLVSMGVVTREEDGTDGRASMIELSDKGEAMFVAIIETWEQILADVFLELDSKELQNFCTYFAQFAFQICELTEQYVDSTELPGVPSLMREGQGGHGLLMGATRL
jgi:DNA-binding MarR family transcriptional regulator